MDGALIVPPRMRAVPPARSASASSMVEEPVKPKGRSRKQKSASESLFEWALGLENAKLQRLSSHGPPAHGSLNGLGGRSAAGQHST